MAIFLFENAGPKIVDMRNYSIFGAEDSRLQMKIIRLSAPKIEDEKIEDERRFFDLNFGDRRQDFFELKIIRRCKIL